MRRPAEENHIEKEDLIEHEDTSIGEDEVIVTPFNPNDIEIETPPFTVGYLMDKIEHDEIDMNAEFQREGDLWSDEKQSRLIESILLGLPLPAFFFDTSVEPWVIIDGLQRTSSINNFCVKKTLKLEGLEFLGYRDGEKFLEGKGFDELDRTLQRSIIMRPITVNMIKKGKKNIRYILFKRLNTAGLVLTNAEIRNAIYQGLPASTIKEFASFTEFKKATDNKISSRRMQDRDFVARFMAFYITSYKNYKPGLDDFVNANIERLEKIDIPSMRRDFKRALNLSLDIFGDDAFRKRVDKNDNRRPINKAYFEVATVCFSKLSDEESEELRREKDLFKENLLVLMNNSKFSNSLSRSTGSRSSVEIRFSMFVQTLRKSISGVYIEINDDNQIKDKKFQIA